MDPRYILGLVVYMSSQLFSWAPIPTLREQGEEAVRLAGTAWQLLVLGSTRVRWWVLDVRTPKGNEYACLGRKHCDPTWGSYVTLGSCAQSRRLVWSVSCQGKGMCCSVRQDRCRTTVLMVSPQIALVYQERRMVWLD